MYVPEGEIGFRIYWEDPTGKRHTLNTSGLNVDTVLDEAIGYIRNKLYLASFSVVGMEQLEGRKWIKIDIQRQWCKGR